MKAWIFDLDGTVVDSGPASFASFKEALEPFGVEFTAETMERIRHEQPYRVFRSLVGEENEKEVYRRLEEINLKHLDKVTLFEGLVDAVRLLKDNDSTVAIWTGRDHGSMKDLLDHFKIYDLFDDHVSGTCVGKNKPDPEGLIKLSDTLKVDADEFTMIGDHAHDVIGAKSVGARAVQVYWQDTYHTGETEHEPDHEFDCETKFLNWIKTQL